MSLQGIETRLERMVEGFFARTFRSGVQPVEIARRVLRLMQTQRSVDPSGNRVGPNEFVIWLSPEDNEQLESMSESLSNELAAELSERAAADQIRLLGPPRFAWEVDPDLHQGVFEVRGEVVEGALLLPYSELIFETGASHLLTGGESASLQPGGGPCSVGRHASSDIVIDDPNVSRHHSSFELDETNKVTITDHRSLNGTRVNGTSIERTTLADGDRVTFGSVSATFHRQ